ncbi:MAG: hypothetical protein JWN40_698 [Phycisphaerales bacterium]|nr:hypothetical protein [Phycisphaerales bacterium]
MTVEHEEQVGSCWECGYSLYGLPMPRCPECGRGFDPADLTTMNMGIKVGPVKRWLMTPPGWPMHLLMVFAVAASVWASATPMRPGALIDSLSYWFISNDSWGDLAGLPWMKFGNPYERFLFAATLWGAVLIFWLVRRLARAVMVKRISKQKAATFGYWRRWLITPMVFGLTVLACRTELPVYGGFWVSKTWLNREVKEALAGNRRSYAWTTRNGVKVDMPLAVVSSSRRLGIYLFSADHEIEVGSDDVVILFEGGGAFIFRDDGEYPTARSNSERPKVAGDGRVRRLSANWFVVEPE